MATGFDSNGSNGPMNDGECRMLAGEERASGNALGPALFFTSLILFWGLSGCDATPTQPAGIEFGTALEKAAPKGLGIVLAHPGTRFGRGKPFAWVARLERPAGTTRLEIMMTHVTPTGAETVLDRQPLSLADPTYNVTSATTSTCCTVFAVPSRSKSSRTLKKC